MLFFGLTNFLPYSPKITPDAANITQGNFCRLLEHRKITVMTSNTLELCTKQKLNWAFTALQVTVGRQRKVLTAVKCLKKLLFTVEYFIPHDTSQMI